MLWSSICVYGNLRGIYRSLWINMSMRVFRTMGVCACLSESINKYEYVGVYGY